jgi:hypothetical protein
VVFELALLTEDHFMATSIYLVVFGLSFFELQCQLVANMSQIITSSFWEPQKGELELGKVKPVVNTLYCTKAKKYADVMEGKMIDVT